MKSFASANRSLPSYSADSTLPLAAGSLLTSLRPLSGDLKKDDLPVLRDVLTFLKFDPADIESLVKSVTSAVTLVGGIVSIVGATSSVIDLLTKLGVFGEDPIQKSLQVIGARVNQIYGYLEQQEKRGLFREARGWRVALTNVRSEIDNFLTSPNPNTIRTLVDRTEALDTALGMMLDPGTARIAFRAAVYGFHEHAQGHWVAAAHPAFMARADGVPIHYIYESSELQSDIWDAGHFIDVLFASLSTRLLLTATLEPAFRSTAHDRSNLRAIADGLSAFIREWRNSMLVANPATGLSVGPPEPFGGGIFPNGANFGYLQSPYKPYGNFPGAQQAPIGIVIGTVDPVTGIADWVPFFDGFETFGTVTLKDYGLFKEAWGGGYDTVQAKDPPAALLAANQRQQQSVDSVVAASGINALIELRERFREAASPVGTSEFVSLPNAKFRRRKLGVRIDGTPVYSLHPGGNEDVTLGRIAPFAADPQRTYPGTRYYQQTTKTFTFRMAARTVWSLTQLGYRLRIGSTEIVLVPFSQSGFAESSPPRFPTETVTAEIQEPARVYDVRQSHLFSNYEEDLFEANQPLPQASGGLIEMEIAGWKGRLFQDDRMGRMSLAVEVEFDYNPAGVAYAGEATVTIRNQNPEEFPDGVILNIQVLETHMDGSDIRQPVEHVADSMTVHIVPSFLVMGPRYFADYSEAVTFMTKSIKEIDDRFGLPGLVPPIPRPEPDPRWAIRTQVQQVNALTEMLQAINETRPELMADTAEQFRTPIVM